MERQLKFVLSGEDRSASSTLGKAGDSAESASSKIGGAFTKLGGQIGGEFGEVLNKVGEGLEKTGEKGMSLGKKMAVGGAAIAGVGLLLQAAGSKEKQATDQLKAAVDATGGSYEDYAKQIEKTVKREENFAHSAVDTKTALQTLTQATGDTQIALNNMQLVTDLAAAKHITLAEAATLVAKILGGGGAKTLAAYGIHMKTNADGTKDVSGALDELAAKLDGQSAASMNNFGAKVDAVKVKIGDFVAEWGQKLGTTLTVAGTVLGAASAAMDLLGARAERAAAKELTLAAAEEKAAVSAAAAAAGTMEAAAANEALAVSGGAASASLGRAALGVGALAAAAYGIGSLLKGPINQLTGQADGFGYAFQNSAKVVETFKQALTESGGVVTANVQSTAALQLQQSGLADKAAKAGVSLAAMTTGLTGTDDQFNALIDTWKKSGDPSGKTLLNLIALRREFTDGKISAKQYSDAVAATGKAAADTTKEQASLRTQIAGVKNSALTATAELADMGTALDRLSNNSIDAAQQELRLKDTLGTTADHFKAARDQTHQFGTSLDAATVKGRSNNEWLLTEISAINAHATAVGKQTGSVKQATGALAGDTSQLRAAAAAAGLNTRQVDALIRKYGATPKQVSTAIKADTDAARRKIAALQAQIDALRGKTILITTEQATHVVGAPNAGAGGRLAQHASGGYLSEGWNTAGEGSATELMYKQGSQVKVLTGAQSAPMLGGHTYITINLPGLYDGPAGGRAIASMLERFVASGGSLMVKRGIR